MQKIIGIARGLGVALAMLAPGAVAVWGCVGTPEDAPLDVHIAEPTNGTARSIVGRWQFVYEGARREAVEAKLAETIEDPAALARAKADVVEEARVSRLEFTRDGRFVSTVGDDVVLAAPFVATPIDGDDWAVDIGEKGKARTLDVTFAGERVTFHDPDKGDLVYARLP